MQQYTEYEEEQQLLLRSHHRWAIKHYADMLEFKQIDEKTANLLTNISKASILVISAELRERRRD